MTAPTAPPPTPVPTMSLHKNHSLKMKCAYCYARRNCPSDYLRGLTDHLKEKGAFQPFGFEAILENLKHKYTPLSYHNSKEIEIEVNHSDTTAPVSVVVWKHTDRKGASYTETLDPCDSAVVHEWVSMFKNETA